LQTHDNHSNFFFLFVFWKNKLGTTMDFLSTPKGVALWKKEQYEGWPTYNPK
jgi:hypothetical protein